MTTTERDFSKAIETDAVIVGAGPVGLFQIFELGLLEVKAHIIDSLPYPGGQPIELFPDNPIYDIPAMPVCTGKVLTDALLKKLAAYLGEQVSYGHWGDLDYGGLQIFQHLRQTCLPQLRPELMDADTYREFVSSGEPFDDSYRRKLERLREQDGFGEFHDLLDAMLLQGKTLEQEAVPVERLANCWRN